MFARLFGWILLVLMAPATAAEDTPELDPVRLAPEIYSVALENERVRVIAVTARPGQPSPEHSHPDRIVIFITPCTLLGGGPDGSDRHFEAGTALWVPAQTHALPPWNIPQACELREIELKPPTE